MNDRFRFRAWDKSFHKYCENVIVSTINEEITVYGRLVNGRTQLIPNSHVVLEQCTGLKDKNGRLIYEGDIVCWTRAQTDGDVDSICPIVFDNDMCSFGPLLNGHSLWMPHQTDLRMKVLGNIHENPELLEDK